MIIKLKDYNNYVYDKIRYFIRIKHWDISLHDVDFWLKNFVAEDENSLAFHLLDNFLFYSEKENKALAQRLLRLLNNKLWLDSFRSTGQILSEDELSQALSDFYSTTAFTFIEGEGRKPTDSGYRMISLLRHCGINERQIFHPKEVLQLLLDNTYRNVVFFDDFIGSGDQCITFWYRGIFEEKYASIFGESFAEISEQFTDVSYYYLALVGTSHGINEINRIIPNLLVIPGELLKSEQCIFKNQSLWDNSDEMKEAFEIYKSRICPRIGISEKDEYLGHGNLGLSIGFSHCIPDNSLPVFHSDKNGWNPLMRRP